MDIDDNLSDLGQKMAQKVDLNDKIKLFHGNFGEISLSEPTIIATGSHTTNQLFDQIERLVGSLRAHRSQGVFPLFSGNLEGIRSGENIFVPIPNERVKEVFAFLKKYKSQQDCLEKWAESGESMLRAKVFKPAVVNGKKYDACLKFKEIKDHLFELEGFQTQLSKEAQLLLFSMFPELEDLKLEREGGMEDFTYIIPSATMNRYLQSIKNDKLFFAGKLTLLEGELEAIASGHLAALNILNFLHGRKLVSFPSATIVGKMFEKLFSLSAFKSKQISVSCDIIENVNEKESLERLRKFKEDYDARITWHNNLCSKKRW